MKSILVALGVAIVFAALTYALAEPSASFQSRALLALNEEVPGDELDAERADIVDALPGALERLRNDSNVSSSDVELFVPVNTSRVEVLATSKSPAVARQVASAVAAEMSQIVAASRLAAIDSESADLEATLQGQQQELERAQVAVDVSILEEAVATREEQEVSRVDGDASALRADLDMAIDNVRTAASQRDLIADEINRLQQQFFELQADRSQRASSVFVVPALESGNVSGTPLRNAVVVFAVALIAVLTASSMFHLGDRT